MKRQKTRFQTPAGFRGSEGLSFRVNIFPSSAKEDDFIYFPDSQASYPFALMNTSWNRERPLTRADDKQCLYHLTTNC